MEPFQLLQTKLYRPRAIADGVKRHRLLARLDDGLRHKLILVSAPPGFGKTTLTSQWLSSRDQLSAWVSLDEGDNNLAQFLRYLCATVRRCVAEACATLWSLLAQVNLPQWITWPIS